MAGATQRGKSAAAAANLRPAVTWGWLGAFVAGVLVAALVFPRAQSQAQAIAGDEAPVLAADMALGEAMRAGDKNTARRLLALQFNFVDADGKSRARRDFLADLKGVAASPASDAKVRLYGLLAMVTGHRSTARNDEVFFLDIWAKQKGTWRALLTQEVVPAGSDAAVAGVRGPAPAMDLAAAGMQEPLPDNPLSRALSGRAGHRPHLSGD